MGGQSMQSDQMNKRFLPTDETVLYKHVILATHSLGHQLTEIGILGYQRQIWDIGILLRKRLEWYPCIRSDWLKLGYDSFEIVPIIQDTLGTPSQTDTPITRMSCVELKGPCHTQCEWRQFMASVAHPYTFSLVPLAFEYLHT